jgi:hypothetical protein
MCIKSSKLAIFVIHIQGSLSYFHAEQQDCIYARLSILKSLSVHMPAVKYIFRIY